MEHAPKTKDFGLVQVASPAIHRRHRRPPNFRELKHRANKLGLFGIQRSLDTESRSTILGIINTLHPEVGEMVNFGGLPLAVSVVSRSRLITPRMYAMPRPREMMKRVPSHTQTFEVGLGSLAVYGSSHNARLGVDLVSGELAKEMDEFESVYEDAGFPLGRGPSSDYLYTPHLSIGVANNEHLDFLMDPETLERLSGVAGLGGEIGQTILLRRAFSRQA